MNWVKQSEHSIVEFTRVSMNVRIIIDYKYYYYYYL